MKTLKELLILLESNPTNVTRGGLCYRNDSLLTHKFIHINEYYAISRFIDEHRPLNWYDRFYSYKRKYSGYYWSKDNQKIRNRFLRYWIKRV